MFGRSSKHIAQAQKIFGVGMSKTGTTTLGTCFEILGLVPTIGFHKKMKAKLFQGKKINPVNLKLSDDELQAGFDDKTLEYVRKEVSRYVSFQDSPWYLLFKELDEMFPNSKFILTLRKDAAAQARSDWYHNCKLGYCSGEPTQSYIDEQVRDYEAHNQRVIAYFKDRPEDLLVVCWEQGHGWQELCAFLGCAIPDQAFPHANKRKTTS